MEAPITSGTKCPISVDRCGAYRFFAAFSGVHKLVGYIQTNDRASHKFTYPDCSREGLMLHKEYIQRLTLLRAIAKREEIFCYFKRLMYLCEYILQEPNKQPIRTITFRMTTNTKLYTLNYSEVQTYLWALTFIAANTLLPQLFHLSPQGGIIFAPLSFVILAGSYKFGWKTGLLAALASPVVNNLIWGAPMWSIIPVMALKLALLALAAGLTAQYFKKVNLLLLVGVVLAAELLGGLAELVLTEGIAATIADFTIGWPGLLLQVFGTWAVLKVLNR